MTSIKLNVGTVSRELKTIQVGNIQQVALVEFLGDSEFTNATAEAMLPLLPKDADILLTVVTNALPLVHELSDRSGLPYVVARKKRRTYMRSPLIQEVPSMSLGVGETLWLDGQHAERLKGKRVAIVQDVVSSGGSGVALARLIERAGGTVSGHVAAFRQGTSEPPFPLQSLQNLSEL